MHADALARTQSSGGGLPADDCIAYDVKAAARVLGIGRRTVYELMDAGEIESFRIGRSRRILRTALLAYAERQQKLARQAAAA